MAWCEETFGREGDLSVEGRRRLRLLGRIVALDVFVHNHDRLPCVWDNKGNLENVMFAPNGDPLAIDTMISTFDPSAHTFQVYLARVRSLISRLCAAPASPSPEFERIRALFTQGLGTEACETFAPPMNYDIGIEGVVEMQAGFLEALPRISFLSSQRILDKACGYVRSEIGAMNVTPANPLGFQRISIPFLVQTGSVFRDHGAAPKSDKGSKGAAAGGGTRPLLGGAGAARI